MCLVGGPRVFSHVHTSLVIINCKSVISTVELHEDVICEKNVGSIFWNLPLISVDSESLNYQKQTYD